MSASRGLRWMAPVVAIGLVGAGLLFVHRPTASSPAPSRPEEPLGVELSGCAAVLTGPICEVASGAELRMWLPSATNDPIEISTDRGPVAFESTAWPDGRQLRFAAPAGASLLEARVVTSERPARWMIGLSSPTAPSPAVERATALRKQGRLDEAAAVLDAVGAGNPAEVPAIVATRARVEYARGHIEGAIALFRRSIALHESSGRVSQASDDAFALAFLLLERDRFDEVRALLVRAAQLSGDYPDGRARGEYYDGLLARATGDVRTALRSTRAAEEHAARLGVSGLRRMARQASAFELEDLGRYREALEAKRNLLASDGDDMTACDRADLLDNIGWGEMLVEEADGSKGTLDPRDPIRDALALFRRSCPDPNRSANALVNLAKAEVSRGRLSEAQQALDEAKKLEHEPAIPVVLAWLHLRGHIALLSNRARDARTPFDREEQIAGALGNADDQRLATEDRARLFVALGRNEDALAAIESEEALLHGEAADIPMGEGRETFFGARDRAAILRVELLVKTGRVAAAARAAREQRARFFAGIRRADALERLDPSARRRWEGLVGAYRRARDANDGEAAHDWELSSDRLAAALEQRNARAAKSRALLEDALGLLAEPSEPEKALDLALEEGELAVLYFPAEDGWYAFTQDARGTRATSLGQVDPSSPPAELSRRMIEPIGDAIARASRIRVLAYGALRSVDVHALVWEGAPLLDHATVAYAMGLGEVASSPDPSPHRALVVADPGGDLPLARAEADEVSSSLGGDAGWQVEALRGADATSDAVRAALARATLFHYAGHASFGGADGFDSALPLASGGELTPGDVLALRTTPAYVLLFGCETGKESAEGTLGGLGLAHAFLAVGARSVVASARVVDDGVTRDLAQELYARMRRGSEWDLPRALRDAELALRGKTASSDWAAFRALVP
jgi:tetratricopeptide (TPR) repeat protein